MKMNLDLTFSFHVKRSFLLMAVQEKAFCPYEKNAAFGSVTA